MAVFPDEDTSAPAFYLHPGTDWAFLVPAWRYLWRPGTDWAFLVPACGMGKQTFYGRTTKKHRSCMLRCFFILR